MNLEKYCNEKMSNILAKISSCSFGVYLIHLIVKYYYVSIFNINIYSWQFRTFGIFIVYFTSLLIVLALKKVPLIKKLLP
jgi:surface polysaccharide O-acyltransferase-like enzyme